jgi:hypothetical protein
LVGSAGFCSAGLAAAGAAVGALGWQAPRTTPVDAMVASFRKLRLLSFFSSIATSL